MLHWRAWLTKLSQSLRRRLGKVKGGSTTESVTSEEAFAEVESKIWGPVKSISDEAFVKVAMQYLPVNDRLASASSEGAVIARYEGGSNLVAVARFQENTKICIKVPACGWRGRWEDMIDRERLRSEALTMRYIGERTAMPMPTVYGFNCTFDNQLGAPYIAMSYVGGVDATEVWNKDCTLDPPSPKRLNILRGIAEAMSSLKDLKFDRIGMLGFGDDGTVPFIKDGWIVHTDPESKARSHHRQKYQSSTRTWLLQELQSLADRRRLRKDDWPIHILRLIIEALPKEPGSEGDSVFVLSHPDLALHNINVDSEGQITGIIDWDGVQVVPASMGWAMYPDMLREDWSLGYWWPRPETPVHESPAPEDYARYRSLYLEVMRKTCGDHNGWRCTEKSHLYRTLHEAVTSDGTQVGSMLAEGLLEQVLPRAWMDFVSRVKAEGFSEAEDKWLREQFRRLFAHDQPTMIDAGTQTEPREGERAIATA